MAGTRETDVLVVGAGPTGLVAACELARRGVRFRVVDKLAEPTDESRAVVVHARSLEMLATLGVVDALIESGVRTSYLQMSVNGKRLARVDLGTIESFYNYSVTTAQTETERILTERLAALGTTIERPVELTGLTQDDDGVHATLHHPDGSDEELEVAYVIGTDGAHSTVRGQMDEKLEGSFKGERFILGDVEAEHELDLDCMYTYFAASGALMVFPMKGTRLRLIAQLDDAGGEPLDLHPSLDRLQEITNARTEGITITRSHWLTEFEIHHAQAPRYRDRRVFIAGDAGHVHSPAGGQGMNTGMQDAFNLAWKIARAVDGRGGEALLDSYQVERHPVAAAMIRFTTMITEVGTLHGELPIHLRNAVMHAIAGVGPITDRIAAEVEEVGIGYRQSPVVRAAHHHHAALRPGDHLPHTPGVGSTTGHTILGFDAGPVAVSDEPDLQQVALPDAAAAAQIGARPGERVVVRPDGYIGAIARDDDEVSAYFAELRAGGFPG